MDSKSTVKRHQLSEPERQEVLDYIKRQGTRWRSKLSTAWAEGSTELRWLRNRVGPSGLYKLDLTAEASRSATADE